MEGKLLAVSGPSGVGKGTIVKSVVKKRADVVESISCTTRLPREGETHGKEYFFITREEFKKRIGQNDFLEHSEHFGNFYGTPKSFVRKMLESGKSVILEIDVVGALLAKEAFPNCVLVMIVPPSLEELERRLRQRNTETDEQIKNRLSRFQYELSQKDKYDYVIVNDKIEDAIEKLESVIDGKVN